MLEILLQVLNSFQPELMLIIEFGVAILLMLGFLKFFGLTGMYAYLISSLFIYCEYPSSKSGAIWFLPASSGAGEGDNLLQLFCY